MISMDFFPPPLLLGEPWGAQGRSGSEHFLRIAYNFFCFLPHGFPGPWGALEIIFLTVSYGCIRFLMCSPHWSSQGALGSIGGPGFLTVACVCLCLLAVLPPGIGGEPWWDLVILQFPRNACGLVRLRHLPRHITIAQAQLPRRLVGHGHAHGFMCTVFAAAMVLQLG